jgi:hypothetical protein
MRPLKAHVRNGRLLLDEPTELPEGDIVELVHADDVHAVDPLTPEEQDGLRAALASLDEGKGRMLAQVQETVNAILGR